MKKTFFVSLLLLANLLTSCGRVSFSSTDTSHLLVVSSDPEGLRLEFYDIAKHTTDASYTVQLPDPLFPSGNGMFNDSIQYDAGLGEVLFVTTGVADDPMDEGSYNADGTQNARLYAWGKGDDSPKLFWDSEGSIGGWVVNPADHTVWISSAPNVYEFPENIRYISSGCILTHFDLTNGKTLAQYPLSSLKPLHLSSDGTITQHTTSDANAGTISFDQFNPSSRIAPGTLMLKFDASDGQNFPALDDRLGGMTYDGKHFAYFLDHRNAKGTILSSSLILSSTEQNDTGSQLVFPHSLQNVSIFWAGNDKYFLAKIQNGWSIYDASAGEESHFIPSANYVSEWGPSSRYILNEDNNYLYLYDMDLDTQTQLPFSSHSYAYFY